MITELYIYRSNKFARKLFAFNLTGCKKTKEANAQKKYEYEHTIVAIP